MRTTLADIEAGRAHDRLYSVREAAKFIGVSPGTLRRLIAAGVLPPLLRPSPGRSGIWWSDLIRHLETSNTPEGLARLRRAGRVRMVKRPVPTGEPPVLSFLQQRFTANHRVTRQPIIVSNRPPEAPKPKSPKKGGPSRH